MNRSKNLALILVALAAVSIVPGVYGQSNPPQPPSAKSSKTSGTDATNKRPAAGGDSSTASIINACSAAADELLETRRLVDSLEKENTALSERLNTEKRISSLSTAESEARAAEATALRAALAAKDETIAAKDAVIANRGEMIAKLKKRSRSPLKRIADILIGVAIFAVIK